MSGVRQDLMDMAVDIGVTGIDSVFGAGKLYLEPSLIDAPPQIRIAGNTATTESGTLDITVAAMGAHAAKSEISASEVPDGAAFTDNGNGFAAISWETGYSDAGEHVISLSLRYNSQITAAQTVTLQVTNTPIPPFVATGGSLSQSTPEPLEWEWKDDFIDPDLDTAGMLFQVEMYTDSALTRKVIDQDSVAGFSIMSTDISGFDTLETG
ncbi:MAG: hypothetical protein GF350_02120, partial [Chitinivibrionales bacterium]|nr:hypothetical protein [Chitinivibrionales bacterium]